MISSSNSNEDSALLSLEELNLGELLDTVLQRLWLVGAIFLAVVAGGIAYACFATPIYRADALIQVEDQKPSSLSGVQAISDMLGGGAASVAGEVEIIRSREVILKAIAAAQADISVTVKNRFPLIGNLVARLGETEGKLRAPVLGLKSYAWGGEKLELGELVIPDAFLGRPLIIRATESGYEVVDADGVIVASGIVGRLSRFPMNGGEGSLLIKTLVANPGTEFEIIKAAPIDAYRSVLSNLTAGEASRQSNIIRIRYEDPSVHRANTLVNAIANAYLAQNVERRTAEATQRLNFLDKQLPIIKKNVEQAEEALNRYRTKTNTVNVEKNTDTLLSRAIEVEKERLQLELQRDSLLQRYQSSHPTVRAVEEQLAAVRRAAEKVNESVNSLPAAQRDLLRLQRDADVSAQLYIALLNDAQQLRVAKAGTVGNVRVIDYAIPDRQPVAPKRALIIIISALVGLMSGVLAAFVQRSLRPTIRDPEEIERATGLPVYATIPESALQKKLDSHRRGRSRPITTGARQILSALHPDDPAVESLRSFRTALAFALIGAENKNIVLTGPTPALGKSFISANLSALVAGTDKRVLLIETDLRRPQLGRYFGYDNVPGLSNVLAGTTKLEDAVLARPEPSLNLDVLLSGTIPPNPGELLLGERFKQLLEEVAPFYDHVILDSSPVLPVADTLAVAQHASTVFLVVRAEQSTLREVRDALQKLKGVGISVKGIIFNGVKRHRLTSSYTYGYYYGYSNK